MATYRRRVKATFDEEQGVFMISVAAELAEMHPQTLRMYEQRGLIAPKRSPKNTRLYSQRDVERLRRIQQMTAEGLNLAGVETVLALEAQVQKLRAEGERLRKRIAELETKSGETRADAGGSIHGQVAGSGGSGAGAGARQAQPRGRPRRTCSSPCSNSPTGWSSRSCRRSAPTPATIAARANEAVAALPKLSGEGEEPRMSSTLAQTIRAGREGDGGEAATSTSRPTTCCWR